MSSTQDLLPQVDLGNTFGALFIGAAFAAILFGVSNVQAFIYFQTHKDTGMTFFKLVVIGLWILDALHLAFVIHCIYYYLVTNYANFGALTEIVWSGKLQIALNMFTVWIVHFMYAYRIWIVSTGRSRVLPMTVGIIVILTLGVAITVTYEVYKSHLFSDLARIEWSTLMYLSTVTFVDFVIASSLCYLLATSRTGFSSTDTFLTKLMVYTINTGCLTSICSMVALTTCAVMPNNLIYVALEFLVTKLYVNSFLALMNARYYLRPNDTEHVNISEFRAHRPSLHTSSDSKTEDLQESRMNVFKHPQDDEGFQAVKRPIGLMIDTNSSSV
ncbi:hypothetical protein K503DRAFT_474472 [Rhizopogon vinicolor AM-OR11-026]|uniref:DUF6534 domain-containing protein n=1 Tax=Rhizopogon vinicolor AM-OR11-026 TaxID=1314800 RepID=A0A1B7MN73_9AGAM|nr:hypothetical protein K503DRAFT_474472 [Rhizopogon vinicolor AM-OR11-026]